MRGSRFVDEDNRHAGRVEFAERLEYLANDQGCQASDGSSSSNISGRPINVRDDAYVLQVGRSVLSGKSSDLAGNADVQRIYLGHA